MYKKHITQGMLAEEVDISERYLAMIESGTRLPRMDVFVKIVNALGVSADAILVDELTCSDQIRFSKYAELAEKLGEKDRRRLHNIISAYLET